GWAILLRQKQKKLIMLPSETMIWQPEFTDKTLSRKPGAVHIALKKAGKVAALIKAQSMQQKLRSMPQTCKISSSTPS
ncbi:hypothetical protein, partial [Escherichia coli]|uniref:hypothetical protein n=1 Tax=Escherichia coli TaxID=562 RepID=UPI001BC835B2